MLVAMEEEVTAGAAKEAARAAETGVEMVVVRAEEREAERAEVMAVEAGEAVRAAMEDPETAKAEAARDMD